VAQACLDACLDYAERRRQFGAPLRTHQLVQRMLTKMIVRVRSAYLLCWYAGRLRESRSPQATVTTAMAKYLASTTVGAVARDAIQVHGAAGCSAETPVARYFRDARIMEIIEGTSQIQEMLITAQTYATRVAC
jgi:alkylation response protein AidB-like acyl-CoA dehydrogenase